MTDADYSLNWFIENIIAFTVHLMFEYHCAVVDHLKILSATMALTNSATQTQNILL